MSKSRLEKFKDYRKSILLDGEYEEKSKINTSLEDGSVDSKNGPSYQEELLLKQIVNSKRIVNILYFGFAFIVITLIIAFGFILF